MINFYVHEQALLLPGENRRIMNEQLLHLALISGQPRCTIRIVLGSANRLAEVALDGGTIKGAVCPPGK